MLHFNLLRLIGFALVLHLYYFESLLEQHGIFYGYKFGPRMMSMGIIKTIIEIELDAMINLLLDNCFEI